MEFFKTNTNINFLGLRKIAACISIGLVIASVICLVVKGLDFGLDFTGGTQIQMTFPQTANIEEIRATLHNSGLEKTQVQTYGDSQSVLITIAAQATKNLSTEEQQKEQNILSQKVINLFKTAKVQSASYVGAKVSSELINKGILAILIALFATGVYIAFRFEYRLAVSAAVALIHDPILILGIFSFFRIEFDLVTLAAVLTIIGYSLNDTVVVFDRIRENFRKMRKATPTEIVNTSINQTLSRTIMLSGLTLTVVTVLFLFGGPSIHAFSLALIIGIVVGTYSSIYVAGALAVALGLNRADLLPPVRNKDIESMP